MLDETPPTAPVVLRAPLQPTCVRRIDGTRRNPACRPRARRPLPSHGSVPLTQCPCHRLLRLHRDGGHNIRADHDKRLSGSSASRFQFSQRARKSVGNPVARPSRDLGAKPLSECGSDSSHYSGVSIREPLRRPICDLLPQLVGGLSLTTLRTAAHCSDFAWRGGPPLSLAAELS